MKPRNLDRDRLDFGNGKIGPLFRALFFPALVGMLFNAALTVIDGMFVGHGVGADGIAAVNIVAPLFMIGTGIGLMLGIGASVVASIRLAEQNERAACIILTQAFAAGLLLLGPVCLGCLAFPEAVAAMLGCTPQLTAHAVDYLLWLLPGLLFLIVNCIGMLQIRLDGSPNYAMTVQVVGAVTNIVLDWYMIFPLHMGVKGAALATSIACGIDGILILLYFIRFADKLKFYRLKLSVTSLLLSLRNTDYMMKIGFATFLTEIAMSVMMLTGNYMFVSRLGEAGVAAYSIACYLFPLVFSISNAVAQAAQPIISYNYGARRSDRVRRTLRISLLTAVICGAAVTIGLWLGADGIVRAFLAPHEPAYALAVDGLPLFALCALFFSVNITFIGYYQSLEQAAASSIYTLLRGILLLVPCFVLLPRIAGDAGLWLAIPAAELLTTLTIGIRYLLARRH